MDSIRYGIYLRPDPVTCWVQTQIVFALSRQFGLVSAAAFPPHATLVGNLKTEASVVDLEARITTALEGIDRFPVFNKGIERVRDAFFFNVHEDGCGEPNEPLVALAGAVLAAVLPLSVPVHDERTTPVAENRFWAHLSLASHDLGVDNHLADEVGEFLAALPLVAPETFEATTVSLFETSADDWNAHWWHTLRWRHLHSWTLPRR